RARVRRRNPLAPLPRTRGDSRIVGFVPFAVPIGGDKTLLHGTTLQHSLFTVFSQFGLLYSVRVFPNAAVAGPGFYAIIKFYSARDAHRAQKACYQKQLFQTSPVKMGPNVEFLTLLG
ncbi:hypothetical protein EI555_011572, partial [Monodon monoceros]